MKWAIMRSEPEGIKLFGPFDNEDECIDHLRHFNMERAALVVPIIPSRKAPERSRS
jgi:hypothetical protein